MDRRVATVFGGSGFIGRHLVKRLARADYGVRVAVRDPESAAYLKIDGDTGQIVPCAADIADADTVARAVDGAEVVVNLVGILYERGRRTFRNVHVEGAATVARTAKAAGAHKLVHVSAIGADADSAAAYARTKAEGEKAVLETFPEATILRPSVVFGPEDDFFNMFAGMARVLPMLPVFGCPTWPKVRLFPEGGLIDVDLYGAGGTKFQPVYVGDVADAIMAALSDPGAAGKTYELGGPEQYTFKQIMDLVLAETGRERFLIPVPFGIAKIEAWFLEKLPKPLLTRDQVELLKRDNVVSGKYPGLRDLGITPTAAEAILPTYLHRFRPPSRQSRDRV